MKIRILFLAVCLLATTITAQERAPRAHHLLYQEFCATCHGETMEGGNGPSLVDDVWVYGDDDASIAKMIRVGTGEETMPGFSEALSEDQIRSLVVAIRETRARPVMRTARRRASAVDGVYRTREATFALAEMYSDSGTIWDVVHLPDRSMLMSFREGALKRRNPEGEVTIIAGTPKTHVILDLGYFDIALHPDFERNGWIYVAYVVPPTSAPDARKTMTRVIRGRIVGNAWTDEQTIFEARPEHREQGITRFGCRFLFDEGYLYFSIGDGGNGMVSQSPVSPLGKVYRVFDDGSIPNDNPYVGVPDAYEQIWTLGQRNVQGFALRRETQSIYSSEHGPRGGDELNIVRKGVNYGWPIITHGIDYDGSPVSELTAKEGMEQPVVHWTPSIAVSGLEFYYGKEFPSWHGDLIVTALAGEHVRRVVFDGESVVDQEVLIGDVGRVRSVTLDPEGRLLLVTNTVAMGGGDSAIYRIEKKNR